MANPKLQRAARLREAKKRRIKRQMNKIEEGVIIHSHDLCKKAPDCKIWAESNSGKGGIFANPYVPLDVNQLKKSAGYTFKVTHVGRAPGIIHVKVTH